MAVIVKKSAVVQKVAPKVAAPVKVVQKVAPKVAAPTRNGFQIMTGVDIPTKRAFGGKRGVYNELFSQFESEFDGENALCVEIEVEAEKTAISKMNGLYNAARRNGAAVTIRVHAQGEDGKHGGVLRMWYQGQKEESAE